MEPAAQVLHNLNRRQFLVRAAALGLSASALALFLEACRTVPDTPPASPPLPDIPPPRPSPPVTSGTPPVPSSEPVPEPVPSIDMTSESVRVGHLLRRAGFGATAAELEQFIAMGWRQTVDYLLEYQDIDNSSLETLLEGQKLDIERAYQLQRWWLQRMIYTKRPLEEKMTLFWHGLLTSAYSKVGTGPYMYHQNQLFREQALGNYDVLLKAISRDPAMLIWLDSKRNRKQSPNENFARELMELFSMGEGNYTETDVRESARAFTGWELRSKVFYFNRNQHDFGNKAFLGSSGNLDGDDVIDLILKQSASAEYITRRLFEFFAYDDPSSATLARLAKTFRESGYSIKAVVREILTSDEFYSPEAYRARIKSPVELVVGTVRSFGMRTNAGPLIQPLLRLGQAIFNPPDVSGWPGGPAWINSSTLLQRFNFANSIATARSRSFNFDPVAVITDAGVTTAEGMVDYFGSLLLDGTLADEVRNVFIAYLGDLKPVSGTQNPDADQKVRGLVYLMLSSLEYQLA